MNTFASVARVVARGMREGSRQLWRNRFLSLSTILLVALVVLLLHFVFAVRAFAEISLADLEARADYMVPLRSDFDAFTLDALLNDLSPYNIDANVLPGTEENGLIIDPRLHLQFDDLSQVESILSVLDNPRYDNVVGVRDIPSEREFLTVVDNLLQLRSAVTSAALWLTALFLGGGVALMINTFRMVLFSRRSEVQIARIVGASPGFILAPFIAEGALMGLFGAAIGIVVFIGALTQVTLLPGADIFLQLWNTTFAWAIVLAGAVGGAGAWVSARQYLRGPIS